jgi:glycerol uptake facilitator-like aquaporin
LRVRRRGTVSKGAVEGDGRQRRKRRHNGSRGYLPENVNDVQALLVELLITFILAFVVPSVATDERVPAGVAPSAIGFALAPRVRSSPAP